MSVTKTPLQNGQKCICNGGQFNNIWNLENLLKTNKYKVMVPSVRDVAVQDVTDSIKPILKRVLNFIILHVRPNNAVSMAS